MIEIIRRTALVLGTGVMGLGIAVVSLYVFGVVRGIIVGIKRSWDDKKRNAVQQKTQVICLRCKRTVSAESYKRWLQVAQIESLSDK